MRYGSECCSFNCRCVSIGVYATVCKPYALRRYFMFISTHVAPGINSSVIPLPRIFDFNDIHRPHTGPQDNMQIGGVRCAISQIWPKFRGEKFG